MVSLNCRSWRTSELVRRLRRRGRIAVADAAVTTSARRWDALGALRATWTNQMVIVGYCLGVSPERLARWYCRGAGQVARTIPLGTPLAQATTAQIDEPDGAARVLELHPSTHDLSPIFQDPSPDYCIERTLIAGSRLTALPAAGQSTCRRKTGRGNRHANGAVQRLKTVIDPPLIKDVGDKQEVTGNQAGVTSPAQTEIAGLRRNDETNQATAKKPSR